VPLGLGVYDSPASVDKKVVSVNAFSCAASLIINGRMLFLWEIRTDCFLHYSRIYMAGRTHSSCYKEEALEESEKMIMCMQKFAEKILWQFRSEDKNRK
jgi:hypothetical protein